MSPPVEAVLFDLYGTLVRGAPEHPGFPEAVASLGIDPASPAYLWALTGLALAPLAFALGADVAALRDAALVRPVGDAAGVVALARERGLTAAAEAPAEIVRQTEALVEEMVARTRLENFAIEVLETIQRAGLKLAIVSNTNDLSARVIRRLRLDAHCPVQILSCEVGAVKPDPAIYRAALEALAVPAERAVAVGDSWTSDVVGALRCGIRAIWVDHGNDGTAELLLDRRWAELGDPAAPPGTFRVRSGLRASIGAWLPGPVEELEATLGPTRAGAAAEPAFLASCRRARGLRDVLTCLLPP